MKNDWENDYEIPEHIDLKKGKWIRNPYVQNFQELNLVSLADDVRAAFPDSDAVNEALRELMKSRAKKPVLAKAS